MSVTNFIPAVWSARLLEHMDKAHVMTGLVNRDYEGDIRQCGDTVKIASVGEITISDYTANTDIEAPQELTTEEQILRIDCQKYYNFQVDDVDAAQVKTSLTDTAMRRAAYGLCDVTDRYLAEVMVQGAAPTNHMGSEETPIAVTAENAYSLLVQLKVMLDKQNVPTDGRWAVLPPEYHGLLLQDARFVQAGGSMAEETLKGGYVGWAAGFAVYMSNNLPGGMGRRAVIASCTASTCFAEQIVSMEAYRMEKRFADAVKGLHVYGAKVLQPQRIAVLHTAVDSGIMEPLEISAARNKKTGVIRTQVLPALPEGYSAVYTLDEEAQLPRYGETVTGWTALNGEIAGDGEGGKLAVAYLDGEGKARAAGMTVPAVH